MAQAHLGHFRRWHIAPLVGRRLSASCGCGTARTSVGEGAQRCSVGAPRRRLIRPSLSTARRGKVCRGIAQLFEPMSEASHGKPAGERAPRLKKGGLRAASWLTIFTVQGHQRAPLQPAGDADTRGMLVEATWAAARVPGPLRAFFQRACARRGQHAPPSRRSCTPCFARLQALATPVRPHGGECSVRRSQSRL